MLGSSRSPMLNVQTEINFLIPLRSLFHDYYFINCRTCCIIASVLAEEDIITKPRPGQEYVDIRSSIGGSAAVQPRAIAVEGNVKLIFRQ